MAALVALLFTIGAAASERILELSGDEIRAAADRGLARVLERKSSLSLLATSLETATFEQRVSFARIVIVAMVDAFDAELERVYVDMPASSEGRRKVRRWSSAASDYVATLDTLLERLEQSADVEVFASSVGTVQVLVDRTPVVVAGPRIDHPESIEETIIARYCREFICNFSPPPPLRSAAPPYPIGSFTGWKFRNGSGPTFETAAGIHFMFADLGDRHRRETACLAVVRELRGMVTALRYVEDLADRIDWGNVSLVREPDSVWHRFLINRGGDYLRLELPALAQSHEILTSSLPWLRAQVEGRAYRQYIPRAEYFLAGLLRR